MPRLVFRHTCLWLSVCRRQRQAFLLHKTEQREETMATYYFSGVNKPPLLELLARRRASGMVNALYAGQRALLEAYKRYPEVDLVMDSGACQGYRDIEAYAVSLKK